MPHRNRAILIVLCLAYGFTVVSFNLIQIQLVQHNKYLKMAIGNHLHPEKIPAYRAEILDSDGNLLAETQLKTDLFVDGKLLDHPADQLPQLADILGVPAASFAVGFDPHKRDFPLASNLEEGVVAKLRALKWKALIFETHERRLYPNGNLAAHVLGFVDGDDHGMAGMEKEMDRYLTGVPGERWVEWDGKNHEIAGYGTQETPAVDGYDVTLTIKMAIQHVVEDQLDQIVQTYQPNGATIIVMDPHTGEILAMGSRPTFNPNDSTTFKPENLRNRSITDMFEPGSIFKTIPLAAALNEGKVTLNTPIFCENGSFFYGGKYLKDDEPNGTLPVIEVLAQSSNIGFAKIGLDYLGEDTLYKYASAFGIGRRTGLFSQQGEATGLLRPVSKWSALSITRIPMGQEVQVTPIQMATAMCAIANGGRMVVPQLVEKVTDKDGRVMQMYRPQSHAIISPDAARDVAKALEQVTIDGTAKNIHIDYPNGARLSYAGKTGTAQKFVDGAYSHTKFVSSFIGFVPAEDPAFVALVTVDEPHTDKYYGAEVSAPVFAAIAKQVAQMMNITPDLPGTATPVPIVTPATQASL